MFLEKHFPEQGMFNLHVLGPNFFPGRRKSSPFRSAKGRATRPAGLRFTYALRPFLLSRVRPSS